MLKPLVKYTGGKFREYSKIRQYFPSEFDNYFEPFFGGGGIFFQLYNEKKLNNEKHINDFSTSLIDFYRSVSSDTFAEELQKVSDAWDQVREFAENFYEKYGVRFRDLMTNKKDEEFFNDEIISFVVNWVKSLEIDLHGFQLDDRIILSVKDKLSRFRKKDISEDDENVQYVCITTSICQAFYFIIRDMYNDWNNHGNQDNYTMNERSAHWFFIREYCFGAMFRFDSDGNFNIPYGGFSYNNKCFNCKTENVVDDEVKELFKTTDIQCGDFETIINQWNLSENDFMFLDPPYDSTFSEYDDNGFTREDHKRLAQVLAKCKCKWLMAIGKTNFISELYKGYNIVEYDKTYMYQARGEYDNKHTTHLVIKNY